MVRNDKEVFFLFHVRNNPTQSENLVASQASIAQSSFQISARTIISIHDHGDSVQGNFNAHVQRGMSLSSYKIIVI